MEQSILSTFLLSTPKPGKRMLTLNSRGEECILLKRLITEAHAILDNAH